MKQHRNIAQKSVAILAAAAIAMPAAAIVVEQPAQAATTFANPVSTAKAAKDPMHVYTSLTKSLSSNAGDGSKENPYNRFEDAVAQVADGGTIYIAANKGAFLNAQDEYGHLPFLIDKNITIKPVEGAKNAELSVRAGGILLGADVTFENITLLFSNKHHDAIFANGHSLRLINVIRPTGARNIDIFAGSLYNFGESEAVYPSGSKPSIYIEANDDLQSEYISQFGNIYAGSMNGVASNDANITIVNKGSYNKLKLGQFYASGALEAYAGSMFDLQEPAAPAADAQAYKTFGDVNVSLHNYQLRVQGDTGTTGKTFVTTASEYLTDLPLANVADLTVESGQVALVNEQGDAEFESITVQAGATLDVTKVKGAVNTAAYAGNGTVTLRKDGVLNITQQMDGTLHMQTDGAYGGHSGFAAQNHVYVTTPTNAANVQFKPHTSQTNVELVQDTTTSPVQWKVVVKEQEEPLPAIESLSIQEQYKKQTYTINSKPTISIPYELLTVEQCFEDLYDYQHEITVNGYNAVPTIDDIEGEIYYVAELDLCLYITGDGVDFEFAVGGFNEVDKITHIPPGNYEITVSHIKNDGTLTGFTAQIFATDAIVESDTKETTSLQLAALNDKSLYDTIDIPVKIQHANVNVPADDTGILKLQVNGQKISELPMSLQQATNFTFANVAITEANNFNVGSNDIVITYSGSNTFNGAMNVTSLTVNKAMPTVQVNNSLVTTTFDYDGTPKAMASTPIATVLVDGQPVAAEQTILYKHTADTNAQFSEELPVLPGQYETKIVIAEGMNYEATQIAGPIVTIHKATPDVKLTGVVNNNALTLTAVVSSKATAVLPNGEVVFTVDGVALTPVNVVNGVATFVVTNKPDATVQVKATYEDKLGLYEMATSNEQSFVVAPNWINVNVVELLETTATLAVGETKTLTANIAPVDASNQAVIWSSDNPQVATVSTDGIVTAVSEGEAYINVTTLDGGFEASMIVTVTTSNSGNPTPPTTGGEEENTNPPATGGEVGNTTPPTSGGSSGSTTPPTTGGEAGNTTPPTTGGEAGNTTPPATGGEVGNTTPPTSGGSSGSATPPASGGSSGIATPPTSGGSSGIATPPTSGGSSGIATPPTSGGSSGSTTPPSSGGSSGSTTPPTSGGNSGSTTPPATGGAESPTTPPTTEQEAESVTPPLTEQPNAETPSENTSNNPQTNDHTVELDELPPALQQMVDSLVGTVTTTTEGELQLSLVGDEDDLVNVSNVIITNEGISLTVNGQTVPLTGALPMNIAIDDMRILRQTAEGLTPVMYYKEGNELVITSSNLQQLVFVPKIDMPFNDVAQTSWYAQYVKELFDYGFTTGTSAKTYSPNSNITRAQFAVLVTRALELSNKKAPAITLRDVSGKWYAQQVQQLVNANILTGYADQTFKGGQELSREQAAVILVRLLHYLGVNTATTGDAQLKDLQNVSSYAKDAVQFLAEHGVIVSGDDVAFNPQQKLTRAQMAKMFMEALKLSDKY